jgi:SAM-dependent methyltransferase
MNFKGVDICCPHCHGELEAADTDLRCLSCSRCFPVVAGIPDLRVFPDPYIDMESDRKKGLGVAAKLDSLTFSELIDYYYSITDVVPAHHARLYKRGLLTGAARAQAALERWDEAAGPRPSQALLEVGCGTGPLLVAAAGRFQVLAGVDVAFRWLVVAKKRLQEAGLDLPLICACAEALPFRPGVFDHVVLDSTIEVVDGQNKAMAECHRVMRPSGYLFISTPNRYSLGPDPHTGVWAGGFWPRGWLAAYVRRQGAIPPKRHLLSKSTLLRLTRQAGFTAPRVFLPVVPPSQRHQFGIGVQWLIALYHAAQRLSVSRAVLFWIGPLLLAMARKPSHVRTCP